MALASLDDYVRAMRAVFAPEKTRGVHAVIQYNFTGRVVGSCCAVIEDGTLDLAIGQHPAPTVSVETDFDLWLRILAYEEDGLMAYQAGLYQATGDMATLIDADGWFVR
jgi:putative sterol carrier protein